LARKHKGCAIRKNDAHENWKTQGPINIYVSHGGGCAQRGNQSCCPNEDRFWEQVRLVTVSSDLLIVAQEEVGCGLCCGGGP
jgi:hypothetical protein